MEKIIIIILVSCFLSKSSGLEMTLNHVVPPDPHGRALCGVLSCVEKSQAHTNISVSDQQADTSLFPGALSTIASLAIFKVGPTRAADKTHGARRKLIATVTSQRPSVVRVSNAIKVDGRLTDGRATLRLELVKPDDCQASYICQVRGVDSGGKNVVRTYHLEQQTVELSGQQDRGSSTSGVAEKLLNLVQQLETRLALIGQFTEKLKRNTDVSGDKTPAIKDVVKNKMKQSEDGMSKLKNILENEMKDIRGDFSSDLKLLENRLEDKIDNRTDALLDGIVAKIENDVPVEIKKTIKNKEKKMTSRLVGLATKIDELKRQGENLVQLTSQAIKQAISNHTQDVNNQINIDLASVKSKLVNELQRLLINASNCKVENKALEGKSEDIVNNSEVINPKTSIKDVEPSSPQQSPSFTTTEPSPPAQSPSLTTIEAPQPPQSPSSISLQPSQESEQDVSDQSDTNNGGWVVIQRRSTGKLDFFRDWAEYKKGFGSLNDEFWLGNDNISRLTSTGAYELRVDLKYQDESVFAHYANFSLEDESNNYVLYVGPYDGTAGDALGYHNLRPFSTYDRDNDNWRNGNCAADNAGAWWYGACYNSNLNGKWGTSGLKGPRWLNGIFRYDILVHSEMKIRRVD